LSHFGSKGKVKTRQAEARPTLTASSVHFEMWILAKLLDPYQDAALSCGGAQFGAPIRSRAPNESNARGQLFWCSPCTQHVTEIDPGLRVQAQIPETIGGQAAAVATLAKRRRGGSHHPEYGATPE